MDILKKVYAGSLVETTCVPLNTMFINFRNTISCVLNAFACIHQKIWRDVAFRVQKALAKSHHPFG